MTRMPFVSDSATFSAASRQIEQRMNRVSPSFHSFAWRSKVRGVDATVKLATAAPEGVKRSSGSPVRFPITVMTVSPAMASSFVCVVYVVAFVLVRLSRRLIPSRGAHTRYGVRCPVEDGSNGGSGRISEIGRAHV